MKHIFAIMLAALTLATSFALPAAAAWNPQKEGPYAAVAVGMQNNGHIQAYTSWGDSAGGADRNAMARCRSNASGCHVGYRWDSDSGNMCRYITTSYGEWWAAENRRMSRRNCSPGHCETVKRCVEGWDY